MSRQPCVRHLTFYVALQLAIAPAAQAQEAESPQVRESRTRFATAEQLYDSGAYAQSLVEFRHVYRLLREAGHPRAALVLYNIARCYVATNREREAIATYEQFLAEAAPDAPMRDAAQSELRELRARVSLDANTGGGVSPVGPVLAATGGAAVLAAVATGIVAMVRNDEARQGCDNGHCPAALGGVADEAHTLAIATDVLLFGGLAIAALGVVLTFVLQEGSTTATAGCSTEGCGILVGGRF